MWKEKSQFVNVSPLFYEKVYKGCITIIYDQGLFGIGVSYCHEDDKFNKEYGRSLSKARALECLKNSPIHFDEIQPDKLSFDSFKDQSHNVWFSSCKNKYSSGDWYLSRFEATLRRLADDMIRSLAFQYVKQDINNIVK